MIASFRFKEFQISDTECGMKLSSDAVLLGAYAKPPQTGKILDIGCGCGILSLMMAQQSLSAKIDAVEINEKAALQAQQNFEASKWARRLKVHNMPLQEFSKNNPEKYDCIISNPPYFHDQLKSEEAASRQSRHAVQLSFADLCSCVSQLLNAEGSFWVILPVSEKTGFLHHALLNGLFCSRMLTIFDRAEKEPVRLIFCLGKAIVMKIDWQQLVTRSSDNEYTREYRALTSDFYLDLTKFS